MVSESSDWPYLFIVVHNKIKIIVRDHRCNIFFYIKQIKLLGNEVYCL
jgi:hypothetical protein